VFVRKDCLLAWWLCWFTSQTSTKHNQYVSFHFNKSAKKKKKTFLVPYASLVPFCTKKWLKNKK